MALPAILAIKQDHEDDVEGSVMHAFTWNPKPKFYEHVNTEDRYDQCYTHNWKKMISVLRHLGRCCDKFLIIPETSDTGKLHCHGWICINDQVKWKKSVYGTIARQGFVKINKVKSNKSFIERDYYGEDIEETLQLIGDEKLMLFGHGTYKHVLNYIRKEVLIVEDIEKPKYDIEKFFVLE